MIYAGLDWKSCPSASRSDELGGGEKREAMMMPAKFVGGKLAAKPFRIRPKHTIYYTFLLPFPHFLVLFYDRLEIYFH